MNGTLGPTSGFYYGPTTGYTYGVTAVVNGVESAMSAPSIAIMFANGQRVFTQDTFNDAALTWSATAPSTTPLGFANATLVNLTAGANSYINPFAGYSSPTYNMGVAGFNYLVMSMYPTTGFAAGAFSWITEIDDDIHLYNVGGGSGMFLTPPLNQWTTYKFPLWTAMASGSLPHSSGSAPPFLVSGSGADSSLSPSAVGVPQTTHYKINWLTLNGTCEFYAECYFSVN
jgi:hypothetical protein